jgi:hypothetical protein
MSSWRTRTSALSLILSALLASACSVFGLGRAVKEPLDLTIVHTGQVYGEILPCG